jgi:hypothetical protein
MSTSNDNNVVSKIIGTVLGYTPFTNTGKEKIDERIKTIKSYLPDTSSITNYEKRVSDRFKTTRTGTSTNIRSFDAGLNSSMVTQESYMTDDQYWEGRIQGRAAGRPRNSEGRN